MPDKWTGRLVGEMHNNNVTQDDIAKELNLSKAYISMILNGRKTPPKARERLESAFRAVLQKRREAS